MPTLQHTKAKRQPPTQANKQLKTKENSSLDQRLLFTVLPVPICAQPPIRRRNNTDKDNLLWPSELAVAGVVCSIVRLVHGHEKQTEASKAAATAIKQKKMQLASKGYKLTSEAAHSIGSLARQRYLDNAEPLPKVMKIPTSWRAIMRAMGVDASGRARKRIASALDRLREPVTLADGTEFPPLIRKWYIGKKTGKLWLHVNTPAWVPTEPGSYRRVTWPLPSRPASLALHLLASTMNLHGTRQGINRRKLAKSVAASGEWRHVKLARDTLAATNGVRIKFTRRGKHVILTRKRLKTAS